MNCTEIQQLIVPHIFGELSYEDKTKLLIHRAQCRQCHDDYNELVAAIANKRGKIKYLKLLVVHLRQKVQKHWLRIAIKEASAESTRIAIRNASCGKQQETIFAKGSLCSN